MTTTMDLSNKYFVKNKKNGVYNDITKMFDGVRVLKVDGFLKRGAPKNVYTASWEFSNEEDMVITTEQSEYEPTIIRERSDIEITFIVGERYASGEIDVMETHNAFVDYLTNTDIWIKSAYVNNYSVHCVCTKEYEPTIVKLKRNGSSYAMGTITLHTLEEPIQEGDIENATLYIGFGASAISTLNDIQSLVNVQYFEKRDIRGNYSVSANDTSYLWVCATKDVSRLTSSGFYIPIEAPITIGEFKCYRSSNDIVRGMVSFTIED